MTLPVKQGVNNKDKEKSGHSLKKKKQVPFFLFKSVKCIKVYITVPIYVQSFLGNLILTPSLLLSNICIPYWLT